MNAFEQSESKVLTFMEQVQEQKLIKEQEDDFMNSTDYKLKVLDQCENNAKDICLDKIFAKIYKDAVPLNDEYKQAYDADLDAEFKDFIQTKCPNGLEYYVKEGIKRKSPFAKKVLEAVNELVKEEFHDKAMNIEDIDPKDLVFNSSDDVQQRLNLVGQELNAPEISQAVKDNVKQTALSEISRAKKEKETLKNIESEMANDVNINTVEAVNNALEMRDLGKPVDYKPSLFEAININKYNKLKPAYESGSLTNTNLYGTLHDVFGKEEVATESGEIPETSLADLAFVDTVKEYTALSMLKALKLESFNKYEVSDLADQYAMEKF